MFSHERADGAGPSGPAPFSLRLHPLEAAADDALRAHARDVVGASATDVQVGRLCPACGSSRHGRPWARVAPAADGGAADGVAAGRARPPLVGVSLSRSGPHMLTAVRLGGGIGVDIEEIAAVDRGWDGSLVLHPDEADPRAADPRTAERRARLWAGKEAVLKLAGSGLRTPMTQVRLADHDVRGAAAPAGFVIAVALG